MFVLILEFSRWSSLERLVSVVDFPIGTDSSIKLSVMICDAVILVCTRLSVDRVLRALLRRLCINGDLNLEEISDDMKGFFTTEKYLGVSVILVVKLGDTTESWVSMKLSVDVDI